MKSIKDIIQALRDAQNALEEVDHRENDLAQQILTLQCDLSTMERTLVARRDDILNPE